MLIITYAIDYLLRYAAADCCFLFFSFMQFAATLIYAAAA